MNSKQAASKVAEELGRNVDSPGTSRLAADLERTETVTTKHTEGVATVDSAYPHGILVIVGKRVLCEIDGDCPRAEQEANATHLALCWNYHADLVAACKAVQHWLENDCPEVKGSQAGSMGVVHALLSAALAKATKGGGE